MAKAIHTSYNWKKYDLLLSEHYNILKEVKLHIEQYFI